MKLARLAVAPIALALAACAAVDPEAVTDVRCPVFDDPISPGIDFQPVSAVLEQRCGTLDCHGSLARPLRIYSQTGLRSEEPDARAEIAKLSKDKQKLYYSGTDALPTTQSELRENWASVCGLEPELIGAVVHGDAPPDTLTFYRKPRLLEKHKGGLLWNGGDPGDLCLANWLTGFMPPAKTSVPCVDEVTKHR